MRRLLMVTSIVVFGCDVPAIPNALLLEPFRGGQSLSAVHEQARSAQMSWEIIETPETFAKNPSERERYRLHVIESDGYDRGGIRGRLRFEVLNDRLASVWLFPADADSYMSALHAYRASLTSDSKQSKGARLVEGADYKGRKFLRFEDVQVGNEWNALRAKFY